MVAFHLPKGGFNMDPDYLISMNLGDSTFANGVIQVDLRGDNPRFTQEELQKIDEAGLVRADTYWYEITPEPLRSNQGKLLQAFGEHPSSTIPPSTESSALKVSFTAALSEEKLQKIKSLGHEATPIETQPIPVRR